MVRAKEEQNCEQSRQDGGQKFHVRRLGQSEQIKEIPLEEQAELVAERSCHLALIRRTHVKFFNAGRNGRVIIPKLGIVVVRFVKELNLFLVKLLDLVFVHEDGTDLRLRIQLNRLDRHHGHEVVGGVGEFGTREINVFEVIHREGSLVEVDNFTLGQEHQSVEHLKNVRIWLMNGRNDSSTVLSRQISERFHDRCRSERVKTRGWLVQEDKGRICDQLHSNRGSLALSSRHTFHKGSSNARIGAFGQLEFVDELIYTSNLVLQAAREFEFGSKFEALSNCHGLEEDIVLLNVSRIRRKVPNLVFFDAIHLNGAPFVKILGNFSS